MTAELVHYDLRDGVATITLDSPSNRNALSARLRRELSAHLDRAWHHDPVRVIVLTHTGPVFCAGMDLKENAGTAGTASDGVREFTAILEQLWSSPVPVLARLTGGARAGGLGLVGACDIAIAATSATFAFSEVRIGVVPAVISVTVLPRLLPRAAQELFLTGETFDAHRATAIGLLTRAVEGDEVDAVVRHYVEMLLLGGPNALTATKRLLRRPRPADPRTDFAEMLTLSAEFFDSAEGREGIAAFANRRPPTWVPRS